MKPFLLLFSILVFSVLHSQSSVLHVSDVPLNFANEAVHTEFTLRRGIILVEARVNGETGTYILDTGAPGLILNQKLTRTAATTTGGTSGLHTPTPAEAVTVTSVEWQGETHTDLEGLRIDLSHLEGKTATPLGGLIGFGLLHNRTLEIDYRNRQLRVGKTTQRRRDAEFSVPFQLLGHVPVLQLRLDGKVRYFLLDTGASINLLDEATAANLDAFTPSERTKTLYGVDKKPLRTRTGTLDGWSLKRHRTMPAMPVHLTDLTHLRTQFGHAIDGILGYPFLRDRHVVVDYRRRRVYFLR